MIMNVREPVSVLLFTRITRYCNFFLLFFSLQ